MSFDFPIFVRRFDTTRLRYCLKVKVNSGCFLSSSTTRGIGLTVLNAFLRVKDDIPFVSASFLKSLSQLSNVVAKAFSEAKQIINKRLIVTQRRNFIAVQPNQAHLVMILHEHTTLSNKLFNFEPLN